MSGNEKLQKAIEATITAGSNTNSAAVYFYAEPNYPSVFRNNIVVNNGGGFVMDVYNPGGITVCDNNNYFFNGTYLGRLAGSTTA